MLDALVSATAALHDLRGLGRYSNSRAGSVYIVKPKQHGPDEVALTVELFAAVEEALGLEPATLKIGIMDEEKRTSLNLDACIAAAAATGCIFVNTGFLDRTGDEIHTDFEAGPVVRKDDMKSTDLAARPTRTATSTSRCGPGSPGRPRSARACGPSPRRWPRCWTPRAPSRRPGANCAWVPSPTAATLHALHYLRTDVLARQQRAGRRGTPTGGCCWRSRSC